MDPPEAYMWEGLTSALKNVDLVVFIQSLNNHLYRLYYKVLGTEFGVEDVMMNKKVGVISFQEDGAGILFLIPPAALYNKTPRHCM